MGMGRVKGEKKREIYKKMHVNYIEGKKREKGR